MSERITKPEGTPLPPHSYKASGEAKEGKESAAANEKCQKLWADVKQRFLEELGRKRSQRQQD